MIKVSGPPGQQWRVKIFRTTMFCVGFDSVLWVPSILMVGRLYFLSNYYQYVRFAQQNHFDLLDAQALFRNSVLRFPTNSYASIEFRAT
jgi:hypothetical protein